MRFLFGLVLGALLVVGAAYVHDNVRFAGEGNVVQAPPPRPIVNWDVVWGLWGQARNGVSSQLGAPRNL